jgi:hypothetical protein
MGNVKEAYEEILKRLESANWWIKK